MFPKNYTLKGKIIIGIYLISLMTIVMISGSYVVDYMSSEVDLADSTINTGELTEPNTVNNVSEDVDTSAINNPDSNEVINNGNDMDNTEGSDQNKSDDTSIENINGTYSIEDLKILKEAYAILNFEFQSFEVSDEAKETLTSFKEVMKAYPDEYIVIEGHSDGYPNFENTAMQVELSSNRINAVYEILSASGVDLSKIVTVNSGTTDPLSKKTDEHYKNDRVELYFIDHVMKNTNGK